MGLLDSISSMCFAGKTGSAKTQSNGNDSKYNFIDRIFLSPEERAQGYKMERAPELIPEVYPGGSKYAVMYYKKVKPDNCFTKPFDFKNKFFDIYRKDYCVRDKDGWQTYPEMEVKATTKDLELLKRRGASTTTNNPNGAAQFVEGKDNKSVKIKGDLNKPEYIQITDTTNGKKNVYTYRKLSKNELGGKSVQMGNMKGHELNGNYVYEFRPPLRLDAVKDYYILESVVDENGNDLMKKDHVEVYALDAKVGRDSGTAEYNLVQDRDCDGNNKSSMKYSRRAK